MFNCWQGSLWNSKISSKSVRKKEEKMKKKTSGILSGKGKMFSDREDFKALIKKL